MKYIFLLTWFLLTFTGHEAFSNHIYAPLREWTGHVLMEWLCAIGLTLFTFLLFLIVRDMANFKLKGEFFRFFIIISAMGLAIPLLMVTNIEIIHYFQYVLLIIILRSCNLSPLLSYNFSLIISLCDEAKQYFLYPRFTGYFDWNDLFINNLGVALGILLMRKAHVHKDKFSYFITSLSIVLMGIIVIWFSSYAIKGNLWFNLPLLAGQEPTAFPMVNGMKVMVLSLKDAVQPFWQLAARGRTYHIMGVVEGFCICIATAYGLWYLLQGKKPLANRQILNSST